MRLLKEAYLLLKVGGTLIYSTCSISPQENEYVVKYALENFKLKLISPLNWLTKYSSNGIESILKENSKNVSRFNPWINNESIGFFIAKFKKY